MCPHPQAEDRFRLRTHGLVPGDRDGLRGLPGSAAQGSAPCAP